MTGGHRTDGPLVLHSERHRPAPRMKAVVIALTLASALGYTAPALRPRASLAPAARVRATSPAPLTAQSAVVAPLTPTIAEARAFELVRGTHFALFSLLAGLELIPTLLMSVLKQNKPQKKKHGFKTRMKTKDGRKIIKARRRKGRKQLGYGQ